MPTNRTVRQIGMPDPLGNQAQNTFDANGNLVQTVRVEKCTISGVSTTESFASASFHDVMNRLTVMALQGPDGSFTPSLALATCASWATLGVSCPPWCTTTGTIFTFTGYDSRGNRAVSVDPNANTTVLQYDGASRQTRTLQHLRADGSGSEAVVDVVTTTTNYDADSRLIRLIDDNGGTTAWTYDTLDRQTVMTFHDGSTRTSVYDLANDVIGYTDENGSVFANTYDVLGRKTAVAITLAANVVGTTAQSFEYDGLSRMTFCQDAVGATNADAGFAFDSLGRGMEEDQTYDSDARYVTHDVWASLTSVDLTYPNGRQVASEFDALYRRNGVSETSSGFIAFWRFFGNRTATVALGNGITCSFMNNAQTHSAVQASVSLPAWGDNTTDRLGYDGSGRLIAKRYLPTGSTTSLVGFTSAYDPSSNKLFERALHAESRSSLYPSYDSMDRLLEYQRGVLASGGASITTPISLPGTNQEQDYDLDALGNWTSTTLTPEGGTASVQTRTHNKLNELLAFGVLPASTPVLYDHGNNTGSTAQRGNGNITDDGTRTYVYDALNRMTTVKRKSGNATIGQYTYDALGRRIQKIVSNGGVTGSIANATYRYLLDGQQEVEELSGGSTLRQFVWGQYIDELIQMKTYANTGTQPLAAGNYYPLQDLLYRTTATTDSSGSIVEAYDYDAYGNTLTYAGPGTDGLWFTDDDTQTDQPACEHLFTGRQYDPETQIYFYRARYYLPILGRFCGRDSIPVVAVTPYQYVLSRPLVNLDPSGLKIALKHPKSNIGGKHGGKNSFKKTILSALQAMCPCITLAISDSGEVSVSAINGGQQGFCTCFAVHTGGCQLLSDLLASPKTVMLEPTTGASDQAQNLRSGPLVYWNPYYDTLPKHILDTGVPSDYGYGGILTYSFLGHELFHAWDYLHGNTDDLEQRAVRFENQLYTELGGTGNARFMYSDNVSVDDYGYPMFSDNEIKCNCQNTLSSLNNLAKK